MSDGTQDGWAGPDLLEPADEQDENRPRSLIQCTHPTPPGFSACYKKITKCLTCGLAFKC